MDFAFSPEQNELRQSVLEFARKQLARPGASPDSFPRDLWQECAGFGILGLPVPPEYGGSGLDVVTTSAAMEALGYACSDHGLLFSLHAHMWAVVVPILGFGTDEQKERWLPGLADGSLIGAHAMSEPDSGSDAYSLRTTATAVPGGYRLSGTKTFVTNGPIGDVFIVFATVNRARGMWGVTAFVLERGMSGLETSAPFRKLGLQSSPMSEVILDDCFVPANQRLGKEGQGASIFSHSMGWERSCILASQVGRMQAQLDQCVRHARERQQFGRPIGNFQLIAAKLADMKVRLETSRLLLYRAAWQQSIGGDVSLDSAMAKLYISEAAVQSGLDALQIHGGYGYMQEYNVEQQLRDAVAGTLYSGTSEIQRLLIARQLGLFPA